jgi:hypothetical protein
MSEQVECPVCGDSFAPSGFATHVRSHNKAPVVEALVEVVTERSSTGQTTTNEYGTGDRPWQTTTTRREQVNRMRAKRDQRVEAHLSALDRMIAETLE